MKRVLLVDDDKNFRRSLTISFESVGYKVYEMESGMEALRFLKVNQNSDEKVTGVVVDARMPGIDGFLVTDQVMAMYPYLRVVILSAHSYPAKSQRYTVLTKPVRIKKLIEVLEAPRVLSESVRC